MPVPFIEIRAGNHSNQPVLHFAHANGYPPQAYFPLLETLSTHFRVTAMEMRPLWEGTDPRQVKDWRVFVGDLIAFVEALPAHTGNPIIGVGHSLGGTVTLMAAIQRPDLFRALVLLDPPLFSPRASLIWNGIFRLGLSYWFHPLVKGAVNRRNAFESREVMFAHYRPKKVFERIDDRGLWAYVDAIAKPSQVGGLELRYSPAWEARVYVTGLLRDWKTWQELKGFSLPILVLRPEFSPTTREKTVKLLHEIVSQTVIQTVPGTTHLAPLEKPELVGKMIARFLC